jgi:hypothetical protein
MLCCFGVVPASGLSVHVQLHLQVDSQCMRSCSSETGRIVSCSAGEYSKQPSFWLLCYGCSAMVAAEGCGCWRILRHVCVCCSSIDTICLH